MNINYNKYQDFLKIINDKNKPKQFISFDGVIGAGKTTLVKLLTQKYTDSGINAVPIYEPVDVWIKEGVLDHFYSNIKQTCYEFQTYVFITRIQRVIDVVLKNPDADIYLLERTIHTDKNMFVELLKEELGPIRYNMYHTWWNLHSCLLPIKVNKWVYLNTSLEASIARINARNRYEESCIDKDYQAKLIQKHNDFFKNIVEQKENVIIIGNDLMDKDFIKDSFVLDDIYNKVKW
jgi:deoxyadenosine/deoxycytidine kinase